MKKAEINKMKDTQRTENWRDKDKGRLFWKYTQTLISYESFKTKHMKMKKIKNAKDTAIDR